MKIHINIKNNSDLHTHQTLNKRIWLMKKESGYNPTHHFSFGERFDEAVMNIYFVVCQSIELPNHQFIGFSTLNKSAEETRTARRHVCKHASTQSCKHGGAGLLPEPVKRKGRGSRRHRRWLLRNEKAIAH